MNTKRQACFRDTCAGVAAVEFAFILPMLLLLLIAMVDVARAVQAEMSLINISREGANLASRASLEYSNQNIMDSLGATAPPLDMKRDGMLYITKVLANKEGSAIRNEVVGQYRWAQGWNQSRYSPRSALWTCGDTAGTGWNGDGSCSNIPGPGPSAPAANVMTGQLSNGDVIYVVEVFYRFSTLYGSMNLGFGLKTPQIGPDLSAMAIM